MFTGEAGQVSHCHCSCPDPLTQPAGHDTFLVAEAGLPLVLLIGVNLADHEEHIVGGSVIPEHGLLKCVNYYIALHAITIISNLNLRSSNID